MMIVGANTWGISSSDFLAIYVVLCIAWAALVWVLWRRLLGPVSGVESSELDPIELAMLNGGRSLAVTAAATWMHVDGVLEPGERRRTVRVAGPIGRGAGGIEREVFGSVSEGLGLGIRELRRRVADGLAARELERQLIGRRLLLGEQARRRVRWLWVVVVPLFVLGIARLVAGINNHKPIGYLTALLCAVGLGMAWLAWQRPYASRAGRELLERRREQERGWRLNPSAISAPQAVALFGSGALWVMDPAFASAWSVPREKAAGWIGTFSGGVYGGCGGGGGGGCSGGGGCGG